MDPKEDDVIPHINDQGWLDIEQYHYDIDLGKQSPLNQYKIMGVPHLIMVDRSGQIVYKGIPSYRKDI